MIVVNRRRNRAGYLIVEGARHLWKKSVPISKSSGGDETSSNLPLQGDQALTCGDGEQEGVLRGEETRDDMIPGCG
jgi:hypothetical protein